jgi:hypothetical protein
LIPGTSKSFQGTLGATNRLFAAPGENVEVNLRPCDTRSSSLSTTLANHVVTVVFQPPRGPSNMKVPHRRSDLHRDRDIAIEHVSVEGIRSLDCVAIGPWVIRSP